MRKHVTPAHPRATILDPARGRRLPPEGASVEWSAYWARLEGRGDVTVGGLATSPAALSPAEGESDGATEPPPVEAHG